MPAIGVLAPVFVVVQALVSWFVSSEARRHGTLPAVLVGVAVFASGVALAVVLGGVLEVVVAELLVVAVYLLGQRAVGRHSSPA